MCTKRYEEIKKINFSGYKRNTADQHASYIFQSTDRRLNSVGMKQKRWINYTLG